MNSAATRASSSALLLFALQACTSVQPPPTSPLVDASVEPDAQLSRPDAPGPPSPDAAAPPPPPRSGSLDPTFGVNGWVQVDLSLDGDHFYGLTEVANGRLVVVGKTERRPNADIRETMWLSRYGLSGRPDPTFGGGGHIRIDQLNTRTRARGVVALPDGGVIAAGYADVPSTANPLNRDVLLAARAADGSASAGFGADGLVMGIEPTDTGVAIAALPGGDIVVADTHRILRYHADGSPVASFGDGGSVTTAIPDAWDAAWGDDLYEASRVAVLADGSIVIAGNTSTAGGKAVVLAKYTADGALAGTFGTGGVEIAVAADVADTELADLVAQPDGKFVVVGTDQYAFFAMRFASDGHVDPTYGVDGVFRHPLQRGVLAPLPTRGSAAAIQPDGKIVIACEMEGQFGIAVLRATTNGADDHGFGDVEGDGWMLIRKDGWSLYPSAMVHQSTGRIVLAGSAYEAQAAYHNWDGILIGIHP